MSNDLNEAEIKNLSFKIAAVFYVYTIVITAMRLLGYGKYVISMVDDAVFDYPPLTTKGGLLFTAIPVAISIYAWKMRFNERSRKLVNAFAICSAIGYIPFLAILPLAIPLSNSGGGRPFYEAFQFWACFIPFCCTVWLFWMCRRLGRLKPAGDVDAAEVENAACWLVIISLFILSFMLREHALLAL